MPIVPALRSITMHIPNERSKRLKVCIEGHCDDLLGRVALSCSDCTIPYHILDKTIERGGVAALTRSRRGNPCYLGFGHIVIRPWHLSPPPHHIILIRDRKASLIFIIYQRRGVLSTAIQQGCSHVSHSLAECNYRHRRRGRSEGDHGWNYRHRRRGGVGEITDATLTNATRYWA